MGASNILWEIFANMVLIILVSIIVFKLYMKFTTGKCTTKRRMDGKTVIVTGANSGIGKETARELAKKGARVIMACRDLEKAKEVRDEIVASSGNENVVIRYIDFTSLSSVREFVENIISTEPRLDVLVNNAGLPGAKRNAFTSSNLHLLMQVNHFGPFLLTNLLLDLLKRSAPSRIIMVSSIMHYIGKIEMDNLNFQKHWEPRIAYASSKLANILTANELARRLQGTQVTANSLHPGVIWTDIWKFLPSKYYFLVKLMINTFFKDTIEGAQTSIHLAVSEDVENISGQYFEDCRIASRSSTATNEDIGKQLWRESEICVGLIPKE